MKDHLMRHTRKVIYNMSSKPMSNLGRLYIFQNQLTVKRFGQVQSISEYSYFN
jgi:hypothetical protein